MKCHSRGMPIFLSQWLHMASLEILDFTLSQEFHKFRSPDISRFCPAVWLAMLHPPGSPFALMMVITTFTTREEMARG